MKIEITNKASSFDYKIRCCNDKPKVTKSKEGGCWEEELVKCVKCGSKGIFKMWHYEAYRPTKEEKKLGVEYEKRRTEYTFEVLT